MLIPPNSPIPLAIAIGTSYLKSEALLVAVLAGAVLFSAMAYFRTARKDPGLTTEFALLVTVLLGALTMQDPLLAAGLSVITTILLAARDRLHRALKNLLSEQEAHDALVFLAATLVILPLAPNRALGPFAAFNPRKIWEFVGGFISASATIGSLGNRAKRRPELQAAAASGAVLATVATIVQMFIVLLVTNCGDMPCARRATAVVRTGRQWIRADLSGTFLRNVGHR